MSGKGVFTISLDLELMWGVRGHRGLEGYGPNILGARKAVPAILELFGKYGVHATWATVGLLFFGEKSELLKGLPDDKPSYDRPGLSPYENGYMDGIGENEDEDPFHYGAGLIKRILSSPGQEIGCHTFSHYYCHESGQTPQEFRADLVAAKTAAKRFGIEMRSLVFPVNRYTQEYVDVLREEGFRAYRGTGTSFVNSAGRSFMLRLAVLADQYLNLSGYNTYSMAGLAGNAPVDIPASRMLKPYRSAYRALEPLRLRRINSCLENAARTGGLFHLWWHPHNFGRDLRENISFLEGVLARFSHLREEYGMRSMNMAELSEALNAD